MPSRSRLPAGTSPRKIPWQMVLTVGLQIAREGQRRWARLSTREREDVGRLVRKSKGRLTSISPGERAELRRLVWKALGPDR